MNFSGKKDSDAEAFLLRIKEARAIVPIADADLFKCLPLFLTGIALYWVKLESENWRNWNDFETVWRARFGDPDYQYVLRDEIFRLTQGEYETAADYFTCFRALLNGMMPPWALGEQLNFEHRNMLPRLQVTIRRQEFANFSTLEYLATRVEWSYLAEKTYRHLLPPEQSIFPLAYHVPKGKKGTVTVATATATVGRGEKRKSKRNATADTGKSDDTASVTAAANGTNTRDIEITTAKLTANVTCWNCGKTGYRTRGCTEPRKKYCYRYGKHVGEHRY